MHVKDVNLLKEDIYFLAFSAPDIDFSKIDEKLSDLKELDPEKGERTEEIINELITKTDSKEFLNSKFIELNEVLFT